MPTTIRYEQAVYGSFPFWDRGYDVLARSPGCRPEWLEELRAACRRYGERPLGAAEAPGLFALRLESGPWAIVGVAPQGADDRGRPGALAFHALFLAPRAYRKAGCNPFALAGALRHAWGPETTALPAGTWGVEPPADGPAPDPRAGPIAAALARGKRVAVEADGPIDGLARAVWRALPARARRRASVATWAFANGNRFDLLAAPRRAGIEFDRSYVDPSAPGTRGARLSRVFPGWLGPNPRNPGRGGEGSATATRTAGAAPASRRPARWLILGLAGAGLAAVAVGLATRGHDKGGTSGAGPSRPPAAAAAVPRDEPAPPPVPDRDAPSVGDDERELVAEGLLDLAARFGLAGPPDGSDPTALMIRLAEHVRYRGPTLAAAERARLAQEPGPDAARALAWDAHLRHFAPDRPLPPGFAAGELSWQLATLAWSFRVEPHPRLGPSEIPFALADALAVPVPVRPNPLADRYPALAAYARFLARLPRR